MKLIVTNTISRRIFFFFLLCSLLLGLEWPPRAMFRRPKEADEHSVPRNPASNLYLTLHVSKRSVAYVPLAALSADGGT